MLFASKRDLHAFTTRRIISVRERELNYYTNNVNNVGRQAALLAGFAFTILATHKSSAVLKSIYAANPGVVFLVIGVGDLSELSVSEIFQVVLELIYLTSTISAMGSTLYTLYICLITSILGPGLALRGPEGSMDRAVIGLARVNREVVGTFRSALTLFNVSVCANSFLAFHLISGVICTSFVLFIMNKIRKDSDKLMGDFSIHRDAIVTGRFETDMAVARGELPPQGEFAARRGSTSAMDRSCSRACSAPGLARQTTQMKQMAAERRAKRLANQSKLAVLNDTQDVRAGGKVQTAPAPSAVSLEMMAFWQGPQQGLPPVARDGDLLSAPPDRALGLAVLGSTNTRSPSRERRQARGAEPSPGSQGGGGGSSWWPVFAPSSPATPSPARGRGRMGSIEPRARSAGSRVSFSASPHEEEPEVDRQLWSELPTPPPERQPRARSASPPGRAGRALTRMATMGRRGRERKTEARSPAAKPPPALKRAITPMVHAAGKNIFI